MKLTAVIDRYIRFRQDLGKGLDKSARDFGARENLPTPAFQK